MCGFFMQRLRSRWPITSSTRIRAHLQIKIVVFALLCCRHQGECDAENVHKLLVNACAPRYQILSSQTNYMLISQCTMNGFNQAQLNDGQVEYKLTNESDRTRSSHRIFIFAITKTTSSMGFSSSTLLYLKSCIISQDKSNTNWLKKVETNSTVRITFAAFFAVTKDCVFNGTFEFNLPSHSYYIISPRQVESKLTSESGDELDRPITFATNFVAIKHCESGGNPIGFI